MAYQFIGGVGSRFCVLCFVMDLEFGMGFMGSPWMLAEKSPILSFTKVMSVSFCWGGIVF